MRNARIKLITEYANSTTLNIVKSSKDIFADIGSVTRSEYYGAYVAGLSPRYRVDIDPQDYDSCKIQQGTNVTFPNKVEIDGAEYMIIRAYEKNAQHMDLTIG